MTVVSAVGDNIPPSIQVRIPVALKI